MTMNPTTVQTDPNLKNVRGMAMLVYATYLASVFFQIPAFIGVIIAYLKQGDARDTPYESHYAGQITTFWVWLVPVAIGWTLEFLVGWIPLFGWAVNSTIGWLLMGIAALWMLIRSVLGLLKILGSS